MVRVITEASKYIMVILFAFYTFECFSVFRKETADEQLRVLHRQTALVFIFHFTGFVVLFANMADVNVLVFYGMQVLILALIPAFYTTFYPRLSRLVLNNMCMLLALGFIMLTRLNPDKAQRQFLIAVFSLIVSLIVPVIIRKLKALQNWRYLYAILGIGALSAVVVIGVVTGGAKLSIDIHGYGIQPSELVKILFVFFVAASFKKDVSFRNVIITSVIAAFQILILVASRDLGAAVILFVTYLIMLYVATKQPLYLGAGILGGAGASVVAYHLFSHVKVRVLAWKDPILNYDQGGYQVAQSLFAIGTGGWFGMGLTQGMPKTIPVADEDFIFSAIAEEMGCILAILLILVCVSCYVMFLNISMQLHNQFYKLVALGLGTCYMIQTFLNIGGVTKFIPSTGVTLPLVSYGGSSILSTCIMFAIIQGLYVLREDEEDEIAKRKAMLRSERARNRQIKKSTARRGQRNR